jgi:hypothetical protein
VEIVVEREQRVGFQFAEDAAEFLFDAVDGMEEIAAFHAEFAAAELPVRSEQEVIAEQAMFGLGEVAFRDQGEIGDVLLILPAPSGGALASRVGFQRNAAQVPLLGNALLKPRETDTKNRSQYAVAGCQHTLSR